MAITPQTDLMLIKSPLELDNMNQLTFSSASAQATYFSSLPHKRVTNISYQRKDNVIRYPEHIDNLYEYNYVMYRNSNYDNKYFYAYIVRMEYVNDNMTNIFIKTDVFQTWQFDLQYKRSFVEREHVNDDSVGLHTIPEDLESGEYVGTLLQPTTELNDSDNDLKTCFCVAVTDDRIIRTASGLAAYSTLNQKVPSGLYYIGFKDIQAVREFCKAYDDSGYAENVNGVFVVPQAFFRSWGSWTVGETSYDISVSPRFDYSKNLTVEKVNYLDHSYVPVNNKLLTFPYSFLQVTNHNGTIVNYNWEDFNKIVPADTNIKFSVRGTLTQGGSFTIFPVDYKNILNNYDESISLGKYPIGGWNSDSYTNWLTQNAVNNNGSVIMGGVELIAGIGLTATGVGTTAGIGLIGAGVASVGSSLLKKHQYSFMPVQAGGNTNVGDVNFQYGLNNLEFKRITIKEEYAKIIDDFWSAYGYKVNSFKVPNISGRRNWNYVKMINPNIEGYIPQEDIQEIKTLFSNGITLWHNTSTFLDYSQNNDII